MIALIYDNKGPAETGALLPVLLSPYTAVLSYRM